MYSSEDLKRFYFQYQTEALPQGGSLQSFCLKNKEPYNIFEKRHKDTRKQIVEVAIDVHPDNADVVDKEFGGLSSSLSSSGFVTLVCIWIDLRMNNSLHLSQKDLSY